MEFLCHLVTDLISTWMSGNPADLLSCQVGPARGSGLGYGLVCGDYLKFLGERTGLCGDGRDREVVLPIKGPLGVALRSGRLSSCL